MGINKVKNLSRNSNIELLRIISMFLIVFFHASGYINNPDVFAKNYIRLFGMWGILGVDLFTIISAYFLTDQRFKLNRVIDILLRLFAYTFFIIFIYLIYSFFETGSIYTQLTIVFNYYFQTFFDPLWMDQYWFVTAYLFMVIVSPIMNAALHNLDQKKILYILVIFSFIPIFANFNSSIDGSGKVNDIFNFLYIYMLVGYLKLSKFKFKNAKLNILYPTLFTCFLIMGRIWTDYSPNNPFLKFLWINNKFTFGNTNRHSLFMLIDSMLIFNMVNNFKPYVSKFVNYISSHTLGIYLFHENPFFNICDLVISKCISLEIIQKGLAFIPTFTACVMGLFLLGLLVDVIYSVTLHKLLIELITSKFSVQIYNLDNKINSIFCSNYSK